MPNDCIIAVRARRAPIALDLRGVGRPSVSVKAHPSDQSDGSDLRGHRLLVGRWPRFFAVSSGIAGARVVAMGLQKDSAAK